MTKKLRTMKNTTQNTKHEGKFEITYVSFSGKTITGIYDSVRLLENDIIDVRDEFGNYIPVNFGKLIKLIKLQ